MEGVLTLGLVSVILGTASGAQNVGVIGALGVGAYIALAGLWGSPISGASMNPARTFVPTWSHWTSATTGSTSRDHLPAQRSRSVWRSYSVAPVEAAAAQKRRKEPCTPRSNAPSSPETESVSTPRRNTPP